MARPIQTILALQFPAIVLGQSFHMVTTGLTGSFFDPPTISAQLNDIVTFVFRGDLHDVTQSSFEKPCVPLPGGFSSNLQGQGPDASKPIVTWDLRITNVSEPIWFFCQATKPVPHCSAGMVGAINPPSISMYQQFLSAAKAYTGPPIPSPTLALSGQGAIATGPPTATTSSLTALPSTNPRPNNGSNSRSSKAAVIGGSVAGGVSIIIISILALLLWRLKRRPSTPLVRRLTPFDLTQGSSPVLPSHKAGSDTFHRPILSHKSIHSPSPSDSTLSPHQTPNVSQFYASYPTGQLPIISGDSSPFQRTLTHSPSLVINKRPSNQTLSREYDSDVVPLAHVNMQDLASQVAAMIRSPSTTGATSPPQAYHGSGINDIQRQKQGFTQSSLHHDPHNFMMSPAPPPGYVPDDTHSPFP